MATNTANDVKGGSAESGVQVGANGKPLELADGVALMESMMGDISGPERNGSQQESVEDPEDVEEVGAGAATEAAGSGSESNSQEEETAEEGADENAEASEGDVSEDGEGSDTESTENTEDTEPDAKQKAINERIGELVGQKKKAEEDLAAVKTEVEELRSKVAQYESDPGSRPKGFVPPLERIDEVREARAAVSQLEGTRALCRKLLAGEPEAALAAVKAAKVNVASAEEAVAYLQELLPTLSEAKAEAAGRLAAIEFNAKRMVEGERANWSQAAQVEYPWLLNRGSAERKRFDEVMKAYPFLREDPVSEMFVADMVSAALAREKRWAQRKAEGLRLKAEGGNGANGNGKGKGGPSPQPSPRGEGGKPSALGKPKAAGARVAGSGGRGNGDSIRDQALKDPGNEESRLRLMEQFAG